MTTYLIALIAAYWIGTYLDQATSKGREANLFLQDNDGTLDRPKFWILAVVFFAVCLVFFWAFQNASYFSGLLFWMFIIYRGVIAFKNNDINRKRKI